VTIKKDGAFNVNIPVLVLWMMLSLSFHLYGQEEPIVFEHINLEHGLANSTVYCICQDSKGFLWFGTDDGLNKYDGYGFKIYRHQVENPRSLSGNIVRAVIEDRSGNLWIGTFSGGMNKFDPLKETFTHYQTDPGNPGSLSNNNVFTIHEDRAGVLWIGTYGGGLNKFDPKTETFTRYLADPGNPDRLQDNKIRTIYEDRAGILWIGTYSGGLNRFDAEKETFTRYLADPGNPDSLSNNEVFSILEDRAGVLWIGTFGGGLNKFSPETGTFTHYRTVPGNPGSLSSNEVRSVYLDRTGTLWVGTSGGLNRFDPEKQEFTRYLPDSTDPGSLSTGTVQSIYEDRSGVLWIGTVFGGLNKFNREKKKFKHYTHVPGDPGCLSNNRVKAIYEDRSGVPWIGTYNGLNRWNRRDGNFTRYHNDPAAPDSLSDNRIMCIYEDRAGSLWIGTLNGLNRLAPESNKFFRYLSDPKHPHNLGENGITAIAEDGEGFLWIGTFGGLNKYDPGDGVFKRYRNEPGNPDSLSHNLILSILADRSGVLWVGTLKGLNKFNREKNTFTCYLADRKNADRLSSDKINFIHQDCSGALWLGTDGGLNRYNKKEDTFARYTREDGLPNNVINGILEDNRGNLWLSTNNGLSMFNPQTRKFKTYDSNDGLQSDEFHYGACHRSSRSGEMFFGGTNGFNSFYPGRIVDNPYLPQVVITGFKISNRSVRIGEEIDGLKILDNHISETREIKLSYKHTTLSFEYVALHYAAPGSNRCAYMMEGLEKEWNEAGKRRFAIYPDLAPGHYVFRVKASNNDDKWNESGAAVGIHIAPPFWQRWWFGLFLGIAVLSVLYGGYRYRTRRLRKKLAGQERVQKQLEQSRDEMEKSKNIAEFRSAENEKLIAAISSIFITVDAGGKISQWNDSAREFFGIPKTGTRGRLFVDVLKEHIPAVTLAEITAKGLLRDKASNNIEIRVNFKKENETKLLVVNINPITDKSGKKFGFLFLAEDITHQKREQVQMLLSQKLEALGQMAAGIAHEIRSPLQYIGDNVRFIMETFSTLMEFSAGVRNSLKPGNQVKEDENSEKLARFVEEFDFDFYESEIPTALDHIVNGVTRVSAIVRSMNEFAYNGGKVVESSDLNEMLKTTLVVTHNQIKRVADLETRYAPGPLPLYCSIGELNQVFLNLVINAADAIAETGKRGLIKVSTKRKDNELIVEIADNGIGIPDEIKDKIYTPFFTTKKAGYGTGQGLPFSYTIVVERHKGKLYFESKVDEGTTFFIHLPIGDELGEFSPDRYPS
jgi:PAS domain S-box-containing protein